jgi:hypothetical protein
MGMSRRDIDHQLWRSRFGGNWRVPCGVHPTQKALDLAWFTPEEAVSTDVIREMTGGHDRLIRLALASVGQLP